VELAIEHEGNLSLKRGTIITSKRWLGTFLAANKAGWDWKHHIKERNSRAIGEFRACKVLQSNFYGSYRIERLIVEALTSTNCLYGSTMIGFWNIGREDQYLTCQAQLMMLAYIRGRFKVHIIYYIYIICTFSIPSALDKHGTHTLYCDEVHIL